MLYGIMIALLAAAGGALYLLRRRDAAAADDVTDEIVDLIERTGRVELDEPLDLDEIADEERRFWTEESWDEADEY